MRGAGSPTAAAAGTGRILPPAAVTRAPGARRALCVGINNYKRRPLRGCVADAERWAATLPGARFLTEPTIPETQATAQRILSDCAISFAAAKAATSMVFQFAGHGTTLPDRSGDEAGGDSPGHDEALCPYRLHGRPVHRRRRAGGGVRGGGNRGVAVISFIDAVIPEASPGWGRPGRGRCRAIGRRAASVRRGDAAGNRAASRTAPRAARQPRLGGRSRGAQRDMLFSACQSVEVAWESGQQGDFTRHATPILRQAASVTNGRIPSSRSNPRSAQSRDNIRSSTPRRRR